jgi:DNA modification methylase
MAKQTGKDLFSGDVRKMSEGYYSGDKPNPNLRAFVEAHLKEKPYDPETDNYDIPAFDKPIDSTKATAIYNMHTYWSKKPHDAIREYIRHYTKPGDLVLDPFCGSGGTALAALMEGRKAIAIDRSPAATFITKNYCTPVDLHELQKAFEELQRKVKPEIDWLYETHCDRCGGKATTSYTVYSQVFQCPRCLEKIAIYDCVEMEGKTTKGKPKTINVCPHCHKRGMKEEISTSGKKYGAVPVLINYICESGCKPSRDERRHNDTDEKKREYFRKYDLNKLKEINAGTIPHWYPQNDFPKEFHLYKRCALHLQHIEKVVDLFDKRNLWALAALKAGIDEIDDNTIRGAIEFCWSSVLLNLTKMTTDRDRLGFLKGTYYLPQSCRCTNVLGTVSNKLRMMLSGWASMESIKTNDLSISTDDARDLRIPADSVDYIFTDPPYADKVLYSELNLVWESWLNYDLSWINNEIVVKPDDIFTRELWNERMKVALAECYRVLKPGHWLSLCFHGKPEDWQAVQDLMAEIGFIIDKSDIALFIDTDQKSYRQRTAEDNTLRDLVINFRKPKPGEVTSILAISGDEDKQTFNDKVHSIIKEYLGNNPGATKDRIYDEVVSHMVRAGRMEAHDFEGLLRQVAEEVKEPVKKTLYENEDPNIFGTHEISRWYLKETEFAETDAAESAKEDAAAEKVKKFMEKKIKEEPWLEGVHYSDIFEQYIYSVKDKPRRQLAEWLLDYFYKTDAGTYRLPQSDEERKLKAEGRAKGTHRRVKRFIAYLQQGVAIPAKEQPNDATLAEWLRYCKRSGLYDQGKLLYEKGGLNLDNLSEKDMVNAEEDYQVCVRLLARGAAGSGTESTPKRGRKAK